MCFRIGRVRVKISFLFFAMLTMAFVVDKTQITVVTMLCSALHELGHICALLLLGSYPESVSFGIFGVRIQQNNSISATRQAIVVLCGPLVNVMLFGLLLILYYALEAPFLLIASAVNLVIGGFNLLPVLPLDGGRLLRAGLGLFLNEKAADTVMRVVCALLLLALTILGILLFAKTGINISLLVTVLYITILCIRSIKI